MTIYNLKWERTESSFITSIEIAQDWFTAKSGQIIVDNDVDPEQAIIIAQDVAMDNLRTQIFERRNPPNRSFRLRDSLPKKKVVPKERGPINRHYFKMKYGDENYGLQS